jgi:hypothetical protein
VADLIYVELFQSMRCAAPTLAADLKTEQALDVTSNTEVVRLDDSGASGSVRRTRRGACAVARMSSSFTGST